MTPASVRMQTCRYAEKVGEDISRVQETTKFQLGVAIKRNLYHCPQNRPSNLSVADAPFDLEFHSSLNAKSDNRQL